MRFAPTSDNPHLQSYEHDGFIANRYIEPDLITYYCGETAMFSVVMQVVHTGNIGATKAKRIMNWKMV